jgi:hypothetical protein
MMVIITRLKVCASFQENRLSFGQFVELDLIFMCPAVKKMGDGNGVERIESHLVAALGIQWAHAVTIRLVFESHSGFVYTCTVNYLFFNLHLIVYDC